MKILWLCNIDIPDLYKQFTIEKVNVDLNQLKLGKSPSPDSIHNEFLVNLSKNTVSKDQPIWLFWGQYHWYQYIGQSWTDTDDWYFQNFYILFSASLSKI